VTAEPQPAATVPRHVAVIMDGNGRWAQQRGRDRPAGHEAGTAPVRMCIEECVRHGIGALTLFAFSSENWQRPEAEVSSLMSLFVAALDREVDELMAQGVRLRFIGDRSRLAAPLQARIAAAEARTAHNARLNLQVAVSYGGRWDILAATRRIAERCLRGELDPARIDEAEFAAGLQLAGLPDPDLFIRTGGERRISNFLLWNLAYTELWFSDVLWPDFGVAEFRAALAQFATRERRFGLTGAQVASPQGGAS
jgi:undecaprenyl diphosphate synthase